MNISKLFVALAVAASSVFAGGCATVQQNFAENKQEVLPVLEIGRHRHLILANFGAPIYSEQTGGERVDLFKISERENRVTRGFKSLASAATQGASGILLVDQSASFSIRVRYDGSDNVKSAEVLQDNEWVAVDKLEASK